MEVPEVEDRSGAYRDKIGTELHEMVGDKDNREVAPVRKVVRSIAKDLEAVLDVVVEEQVEDMVVDEMLLARQ
jgi:hypothetical protein